MLGEDLYARDAQQVSSVTALETNVSRTFNIPLTTQPATSNVVVKISAILIMKPVLS
jgi:hypothetical protein